MNQNNKHIVPAELLIKYFAKEATEKERAEIELWRNNNDLNQKEFNAFQKLWNITGNVSDKEDINIDVEWNKMQSVIASQKSKVIPLKRWLQIAASILLIASIGFFGYQQSKITTQKTEITTINKFQLPDGSLIHLNASSKISYDNKFGNEHRKIKLKGEAYFKVAPNKKIPFIIEAKNTRIEVLGTEFNVKAYKDEIEVRVMVKEGKVKFYNNKKPEKQIILLSGESGTYNKEINDIKKESIQNLNDIAWITRKIDFYNTLLSDVGKVLQYTYHREFIISENIKNCAITVTFENLSLEEVLKVLKSTLNLEILEKNNTIIVSGKGC